MGICHFWENIWKFLYNQELVFKVVVLFCKQQYFNMLNVFVNSNFWWLILNIVLFYIKLLCLLKFSETKFQYISYLAKVCCFIYLSNCVLNIITYTHTCSCMEISKTSHRKLLTMTTSEKTWWFKRGD